MGFLYPLIFASSAYAQINICPQAGASGTQFAPLCNLNFDDFGTLVSRLITLILIIAIVVSIFFLIYGGIKWITSGGDKTAVEGARNHIVAAIVGLVIALLAFFILNVIGGLFGINLTNLTLPNLTP